MIITGNKYAIPMKRGWILIGIVFLIGITGCTQVNRFLYKKGLAPPGSSVYRQFDKAEQAMRDKRYDDAKRLYESIVQTEQGTAVIQQARYGLASISMLTADDLSQYREGLQQMRAWAANSTLSSGRQDPRHLLPLLEKRERGLEALQECRKNNEAYQKRIAELRSKHKSTLSELQKLRREQEQLRQKIRGLEKLYNNLLETRKDL